jgi:hypothetical protein
MNKSKILIILLVTIIGLLTGCSDGGGTNNFPNPGFTLQTQRINSLGIPTNVTGVVISGYTNRPPDPGFTGTVRQLVHVMHLTQSLVWKESATLMMRRTLY